MAKQLDIRINGRSFSVYPTKLERKKVYGWNELRVVTPDGTPCQQAGLNSDGVTIIKESRIPSPIQISIIASVLRPNVPNTPILSVDQPQN